MLADDEGSPHAVDDSSSWACLLLLSSREDTGLQGLTLRVLRHSLETIKVFFVWRLPRSQPDQLLASLALQPLNMAFEGQLKFFFL